MPSAGDEARARQWLDEALERHRGDLDAWRETGRKLKVQRGLVDLSYGNRVKFSEATGLNYRLIYELEVAAGKKAKSSHFTLDKILAAAEAYGVQPVSIGLALDGGELAGAGEPPVAIPDGAPSPLPRVDLSGEPIAGELREAIQDDVDAMHAHLLDVVAETGKPDPPGAALFADPLEATMWDRLRGQFPSPLRRLVIIAGSAVPREGEPGRRHGSAAGLTASGRATAKARPRERAGCNAIVTTSAG